MPRWEVKFDLHIAFDDPGLVKLISEASALARVIHGIPIPPTVRSELDRLNIHRAVRGTTGIEGSDLTESEVDNVLFAEPGEQVLPDSRQREEQEIRNAYAVFSLVAQTLDADPARPITEESICEIHRLTTQDIDYPNNVPGEYRSHAVHAGDYSAPPTGEDVRRLMGEFIDWLNQPGSSEWPDVVRAIAAHFYLISIHPFGDGNGRTARAVESYLLYQAGINACGFYSLSNYYYNRRQDYEAMLDHIRFASGADLTPFVKFAASGLVAELAAVHDEVLRQITKIAYRDYALQYLMMAGKIGTKAGSRMSELIRALVGYGELELDSPHIRNAYAGFSRKTLTRDLNYLVKEELIVRKGPRVRANLAIMEPFKISVPGESNPGSPG